MDRRPILIDCDPGVDDSIAIAALSASPACEILGISIVAGNVPVEVGFRNAQDLLGLVGLNSPIRMGRKRPDLQEVLTNYPQIHGSNGLGGVLLKPAGGTAVPGDAISGMAGVLSERDAGSVTLLALGPLTNVADLLSTYPREFGRVREIVVMGGSASRGNVTPFAEFNIWADPFAAKAVLEDPRVPIRLVGLDVTRLALATPELIHGWSEGSKTGRVLSRMVRGYLDQGPAGWPLHDALAALHVLDAGILEFEVQEVSVDIDAGEKVGKTTFRAPAGLHDRGLLSFARRVDVGRFSTLLHSLI